MLVRNRNCVSYLISSVQQIAHGNFRSRIRKIRMPKSDFSKTHHTSKPQSALHSNKHTKSSKADNKLDLNVTHSLGNHVPEIRLKSAEATSTAFAILSEAQCFASWLSLVTDSTYTNLIDFFWFINIIVDFYFPVSLSCMCQMCFIKLFTLF